MPSITVQSFSFKQGAPAGADMIFDVRFLKNPHYDPVLKDTTGLDASAGDYIESDPQFAPFFDYMQTLVGTALPNYLKDAKPDIVIAIGCTGGRHRSVFVTEKLARALHAKGHTIHAHHRELAHVG